MRTVLLVIMAGFTWATASGQDSLTYETTFPIWSISKPVQQLQFKDTAFRPARVYTGNAWIMTKDVHQLQLLRGKRYPHYKGRLTDTPASAISKGVARMQYERAAKARKKD